MKNLKPFNLFIFLFAGIVSLFAQTPQMQNFYIPPNQVVVTNTTNGLPTVSAMSVIGAPSPARFSNGIYDNSGTLIFYIADNYFYKPSSGTSFGNLGYNMLPIINDEPRICEIAIVPFNCEAKKYHIFYVASEVPNGTRLYHTTVDMTGSGSVAAPTSVFYFSSADVGGVAVGNLTPGGRRYVYAVSGGTSVNNSANKVVKVVLNPENTLGTVSTIAQGNNSPFTSMEFATAEVDLSHDGTKLAWASMGNANYKVCIMNLNTAGDFNGTFNSYTYGAPGNTGYGGRGVEFNSDGSKLYAGGIDGIYQITGTNADLSNEISGTDNYGKSQLEMGWNGYIYAVGYGGTAKVRGINPANNSLTSEVSISNRTSESQATSMMTIPDQIDGFNYGAQPSVSFTDDNETISTSATWTTSTNPWSVTTPRIKNSITLTSGVTTINNMTIEFGVGATFNVQSGATLRLYNTTLQAACPISMWQGVVVTGTGTLIMDDLSSNPSEIYDAIKGIDVQGSSAVITVTDGSIFNKNERAIFINNGNSSNSITESVFNNTTALIDQTKGVDQNNGNGIPRYGIASIQIEGSANDQTIGSSTLGSGNTFNDGQYGIYAYNSDVNSYNNKFNTLRTRGIFSDGAWSGRNLNVKYKNEFTSCKTAIDGHYAVNLTVQDNTFTGGTEHGITWVYNNGAELIVGDESNSSLKNTFTSQNWSAILANDNANTNTKITIGYNIIQSAAYAGGIYVQETNSPSSRTHNKIRIVKNEINDIGDCVTVTNVWGYTGSEGDQVNADPTTETFKISNNDIDFSTTYGAGKIGINVGNSRYMRARFNNVATTSNASVGNKAIHFGDSRLSLVEKNYAKGNLGISLGGDVLSSNVSCNTLEYCKHGIYLTLANLRTNGATDYHGTTTGADDRPNYFSSTLSGGYDMTLSYSQPTYNKWVGPNTTSINYSPYSGNIIVTGSGDRCWTLDAYETLTGGEETYKTDEDGDGNQEEDGNETNDYDPYWFNNIEGETWTIAYHEQAEHIAADDGLLVTDNAFIPAVINLEQLLSNSSFDEAREAWSALVPVHPYEQNLKDVYDVVLSYRPEEPRALTDVEAETLVAVAEQSPAEAGPAVYSARAILKYKLNMDFYDETPDAGSEDGSFKTTPEKDPNFSVYPVPTKHTLTAVSDIKGTTYYKIVSLDGRLVAQGNFTMRSDLNMSNISAGSYYFEMADETGNVHFRKLICKE